MIMVAVVGCGNNGARVGSPNRFNGTRVGNPNLLQCVPAPWAGHPGALLLLAWKPYGQLDEVDPLMAHDEESRAGNAEPGAAVARTVFV